MIRKRVTGAGGDRMTGICVSCLDAYAIETLAAESPREKTPRSLLSSTVKGDIGETATGEQHNMEPMVPVFFLCRIT